VANTSRKGSSGECFVRAELEAKGALVGSRRHIGGAGDELALFPSGEVWLVEVKTLGVSQSPYKGFTRLDRREMKETPLPPGGSRWLAVVRGSGKTRRTEWIAEADWP
jgi:hypothetical protein